jgi:hypothetical protein
MESEVRSRRIISTAVASAMILVLALAIFGVVITTPASRAQAPTSHMGTLTCVLSPASD